MKIKTIKYIALLALAVAIPSNLTAIAKYKALQLKEIKDPIKSNNDRPSVSLAFKKFTKADCHKYLGRRNILSKGIQPIQIQFTNNTNQSLTLSADNFSLPCIPYQEVAECIYFNTSRRLTLWGIGTLFIWPLIIPFTIEAIESPKANERLDADFQNKTLNFVVVEPHQTINKLVFVDKADFSEHFSFTFINQNNNEKLTISTINPHLTLN